MSNAPGYFADYLNGLALGTERNDNSQAIAAMSPQGHGPIAAMMKALKSGKSYCLTVLGDSTGNETTEWVYRLGELLGGALPNIRVQHALFNDAGSKYDDWTVIQAATGERYLRLAGTKGRFFAETEVTDIASDLTVDVKLSMDDWTPAAESQIVSHYGSAGNRGWRLYIATSGALNFQWSNDGTTLITLSTAGSLGYTDGTVHWVRATIDVDNGGGGYDAKLYKSDDGITWTQVATVSTAGGTTSIYNPTASNIEVGSRSGGSTGPLTGKVYDVRIQSAYDTTAHTTLQPVPMEAWHALATDGNSFSGSPTLYIYNGSVAGAGLSYLTNATRFPRLLPNTYPGLVILSTSHNDAGQGGAPWLASWDAWLAQVLARAPGIGVAALVQNPRNTPADYIDDHATRMSVLPGWAERNRAEILDGWSAFFDSSGALISSYVDGSDGIHPTTTGREVMAQAIAKRFLVYA